QGVAVIGGHCHRVDRIRVSDERSNEIAGSQIPELESTVVRARERATAVVSDHHSIDPVRMTQQDDHFLKTSKIRQADHSVKLLDLLTALKIPEPERHV